MKILAVQKEETVLAFAKVGKDDNIIDVRCLRDLFQGFPRVRGDVTTYSFSDSKSCEKAWIRLLANSCYVQIEPWQLETVGVL